MKNKDCKCKACTCGKEVTCKCAENVTKLKEKLKRLENLEAKLSRLNQQELTTKKINMTILIILIIFIVGTFCGWKYEATINEFIEHFKGLNNKKDY